MDPRRIPDWTGDPEPLRALQSQLAGLVRLKDDYPRPIRTVAGLDVAFEDEERTARAAAVLLDAASLQVLESHTVRVPVRMPYVRGLLSFRELPALLEVLDLLATRPDIALVDGQGIAHPRRLGLASHFGVAADLPSIGVAKRVLMGSSSTPLHDMRGAFTTLREEGRQVGWLLRSQVGEPPLVVSPGHRVAMATAPEMVMRFVTDHRLPEPMRIAARVAGVDGSSASDT